MFPFPSEVLINHSLPAFQKTDTLVSKSEAGEHREILVQRNTKDFFESTLATMVTLPVSLLHRDW
jgi:hypothetical protein